MARQCNPHRRRTDAVNPLYGITPEERSLVTQSGNAKIVNEACDGFWIKRGMTDPVGMDDFVFGRKEINDINYE